MCCQQGVHVGGRFSRMCSVGVEKGNVAIAVFIEKHACVSESLKLPQTRVGLKSARETNDKGYLDKHLYSSRGGAGYRLKYFNTRVDTKGTNKAATCLR